MSKDKWVRRFSVDETAKHKNGFTIYKITSVIFPLSAPEAVSLVSVWKRYSEARALHASMRSLHGRCPALPSHGYFARFQPEVIEERAKSIKNLLEFIAEHKLLFTSTDFVNFLQSGHPEPERDDGKAGGVIAAIRWSLRLPAERVPPIEYQDEDQGARTTDQQQPSQSVDETDYSQIPIYEAADVEIRPSPKTPNLSNAESFESLNSLDSISSDLYSELEKVTITEPKSSVKKNVLPDLINFDAPSTSKFEDYHTMPKMSESVSVSEVSETVSLSSSYDRSSCVSVSTSVSVPNVESKSKTEDSYVFEAGYMLNLAARYEDMKEYHRAFECYKAGIEKMLIGVQTDSDPHRRALIKQKTNKYLSYAEAVYKNHLCDVDQSLVSSGDSPQPRQWALPASLVKRPYEELGRYRVLAALGSSLMLVLHQGDQACYAMKVIQKIPNNLTEFDEYFLQTAHETKEPILPTLVPYMVPLHAYIETNNLYFLILSYAPGEKLFDYIRNYAKSIPTTPAREVNLENVFTEPKTKKTEVDNDIDNNETDYNVTEQDTDRIEDNIENSNNNNDVKTDMDMSVNELVINSQRLLQNVDKVLSDTSLRSGEVKDKVNNQIIEEKSKTNVSERTETPTLNRLQVLPPGAPRRWGAELLTAIEGLHNGGVICRDLNPSNILLGDRGQIILTYQYCYPDEEVALSKLRGFPQDMFVAPELHWAILAQGREGMGHVCDYWSFGAIMYELLCGQPLSMYHRSVFTAHTVLHLPDGLPLEQASLLTQLLTYDPSERLGAGRDGILEIKRHPYFAAVDWTNVYNGWTAPS